MIREDTEADERLRNLRRDLEGFDTIPKDIQLKMHEAAWSVEGPMIYGKEYFANKKSMLEYFANKKSVLLFRPPGCINGTKLTQSLLEKEGWIDNTSSSRNTQARPLATRRHNKR
jgi:hypothetical protein